MCYKALIWNIILDIITNIKINKLHVIITSDCSVFMSDRIYKLL